jgi:hypothetical protein
MTSSFHGLLRGRTTGARHRSAFHKERRSGENRHILIPLLNDMTRTRRKLSGSTFWTRSPCQVVLVNNMQEGI